jgi:Na+/proline symporter
MQNLAQKRKASVLVILATVVGSGLVAAAPKTSLDSAKQVFLTVADVAMCMTIWDIYFQENLYQKQIKSILLELFVVIVVSAITAYVTSRGITVLSNQLIVSLGMMGWAVIGTIAALAATLLGVTWAFYCDDIYKN